MKTALRSGWLCWLGCLLCLGSTQAATLSLEGQRLLVVGTLDGSGLPAFTEQVANGRVRVVVFENSLAGTAEVAEAYAQVIRDKGLSTEVRGLCEAACAYAFLAGKVHRFGHGGGVDALLIPLTRRPTPEELGAGHWQSVPTVAADTTPVAAPAEREGWQSGKGLLFTATPTLFGLVYNTYYCDGSQGTDHSRCERLSDADPHKLGVLND